MDKVVEIFSEEETKRAFKTKRLMLIAYFLCLFVVVSIIITLMVININRISTSYDRSLKGAFTALSSVLGAVFAASSYFFFSIKFRLTKKYVKMLKGFKNGILDTQEVKFLEFDKSIVFKDGVYFYALVVNSKPLRRDDITIRRILVEHTFLMPEFCEGDKLRVTTHGNILVSFLQIQA